MILGPLHKYKDWLSDRLQALGIDAQKMVVNRWEGYPEQSDPASSLVIYAHFDPHSRIDPYVLFALQALRKLPARVILASTSPTLDPEDLKKARRCCSEIFLLKNQSLDFGSWRTVIRVDSELIKASERLILLNDSVYGPFFPLVPILDEMTGRGIDFWGLTEGGETPWHVQSYFLVFEKRALTHRAFDKFWKEFQYIRDKNRIIGRYEIGLSQLLRKSIPPISFDAWVSKAKLQEWSFQKKDSFEYFDQFSSGKELNPTLYYWKPLIEAFHFPFLKTELLKRNRIRSKEVGQWRGVLEKTTDYPIELIENHLKRMQLPFTDAIPRIPRP